MFFILFFFYSWRPFLHLKACVFFYFCFFCHGLLVVLVCCTMFLCNIVVHYRSLDIVVVFSSTWLFLVHGDPLCTLTPAFCCHGLLVVLVRCSSFVTLWYNIGPLTLLSFSVQRVYFCFMATLSAPKSLFFVAMDFW